MCCLMFPTVARELGRGRWCWFIIAIQPEVGPEPQDCQTSANQEVPRTGYPRNPTPSGGKEAKDLCWQAMNKNSLNKDDVWRSGIPDKGCLLSSGRTVDSQHRISSNHTMARWRSFLIGHFREWCLELDLRNAEASTDWDAGIENDKVFKDSHAFSTVCKLVYSL